MVRTLHSTEGTTKAHALALSLMPVLSPDLGESGDDECAVQRGEKDRDATCQRSQGLRSSVCAHCELVFKVKFFNLNVNTL